MATRAQDPNTLAQLAQLADLGRRAAMLAHEIRQPLFGIKAFAQMIEEDPSSAARHAPEIVKQAVVMEALLERFRLPSQEGANAPRPRRARVPEAVASAAGLLERRLAAARIELVRELPEDVPDAAIDPVSLQQVLTNLLVNAIEAFEGRPGRIRVAAGAVAGALVIAVEDDGPGIPESARATLFLPFETSKPSGTGLGLYVSRTLLQDAGGGLELDTDSACTRFLVTVPICQERAETA